MALSFFAHIFAGKTGNLLEGTPATRKGGGAVDTAKQADQPGMSASTQSELLADEEGATQANLTMERRFYERTEVEDAAFALEAAEAVRNES